MHQRKYIGWCSMWSWLMLSFVYSDQTKLHWPNPKYLLIAYFTYISKIFAYSYHLVIVIRYERTHGDYIEWCYCTFTKLVKGDLIWPYLFKMFDLLLRDWIWLRLTQGLSAYFYHLFLKHTFASQFNKVLSFYQHYFQPELPNKANFYHLFLNILLHHNSIKVFFCFCHHYLHPNLSSCLIIWFSIHFCVTIQ